MKREPVNSSTIKEVGYDEATQTLEILFTSGGVYQYEGVPKETFDTFMRTESRGHFFQACIRPCYVCARLHLPECGAPRGETCAMDCLCWCHKQRKDVSNATYQKKADAPAKKGKAKRPPV